MIRNVLGRVASFHYFFLGLLLIPCWIIGVKYFLDLKTIYKVAELAGTNPIAVYNDFKGDAGRFFYGPIFIWLVRPMAFVPKQYGTLVWLIPQTLSYVIFWTCLLKLMPNLFQSRQKWWWLLLFAFTINPIHNNFQSNNIQLILCAMLMLGEVLMAQKSKVAELLGASLVSLASVIKIFPVFMWGYYLIKKPTRVKVFLLISFVFFIGFPMILLGLNDGVEMYRGLIANISTYQKDNSLVGVVDILCFPSLVARIATVLKMTEDTFSVLTKGMILLISTYFFYVTYVQRKNSREYLVALWALGLALMTFLNPSTRVHYFIFYVPAFCVLITQGTHRYKNSKVLLVYGLTSFVLIALTTEGVVGKSFNNTLEALSIPTWGVIILLGGIIHLLKIMSKECALPTPTLSN